MKNEEIIETQNGVEYTSVTKKESGVVEEKNEELQHTKTEISKTPLSRIKVGGSVTKNMGNYNSIKIEVMLELPCKSTKESLQKAYVYASEWVSDKIEEEIAIAEGRKPKNMVTETSNDDNVIF
jgi:hypothetical protein